MQDELITGYFDDDPEYQELKQKMTEAEAEEALAWKYFLQTPQGKYIAKRLLQFTGIGRNPFDKHNSEMSKNCGKMDVGFYVEDKAMKHAPQDYIQIFRGKTI